MQKDLNVSPNYYLEFLELEFRHEILELQLII